MQHSAKGRKKCLSHCEVPMWGQCGEGTGQGAYIERRHLCGELGEYSLPAVSSLGFRCTGVY